jgi:hypothetical protein
MMIVSDDHKWTLYYKNILMIVSYGRKWTLYYEIIMMIVSALPLALVSHNLERHLRASLKIVTEDNHLRSWYIYNTGHSLRT